MLTFKEINQKKDSSALKDVKLEMLNYIKNVMEKSPDLDPSMDYGYFRRLKASKMLGKGFSWRLVTKQGKIMKRIQKIFRDTYKHKLPDNVVSIWGQKISDVFSGKGKVKYAISPLNWSPGTYGDGGSCMISRSGGYRKGAVRFQNAGGRGFLIHDQNESPVARILFVKINQHFARHGVELTGDVFLAFNAYGRGKWNRQSMIQKCFKAAMETKSGFRVNINQSPSNRRRGGTNNPFINGGRGIICGNRTDIRTLKSATAGSVTINWDRIKVSRKEKEIGLAA